MAGTSSPAGQDLRGGQWDAPRRSQRILDAYLEQAGLALVGDAPIFRNRPASPIRVTLLATTSASYANWLFRETPARSSISVAAGRSKHCAGEVNPGAMAAKMGNTIDHNRYLAKTYLPNSTATVRLADEARKRGRKVSRERKMKESWNSSARRVGIDASLGRQPIERIGASDGARTRDLRRDRPTL